MKLKPPVARRGWSLQPVPYHDDRRGWVRLPPWL